MTLEELGLSSLERIELMVALEDALNTNLDESAVANASTVADLERLAAQPASLAVRAGGLPSMEPRLAEARGAPREQASLILLPLARAFPWSAVEGPSICRICKVR